MKSIAVCVLFYNKVDQTIECLESFVSSGVSLYVLNNNSDLEARKTLGEFCGRYSQITLYDSPENLGVGRGRNYLINHTSEDWLLFVDNDITVKTPDWLDKISQHIVSHPDVEVFIPRMFNVHTNGYAEHLRVQLKGTIADFSWVSEGVRKTNMFPGGASFCHRSLFKHLGNYDDQMFVGFEDFEMGIRGLKMERPVVAQIIGDIELVHDHKQLTNNADIEATKVRYDFKKIAASEKRIYDKHAVVLNNDWRPWVKDQLALLNKSEKTPCFIHKVFSSLICKLKMQWQRQK